MKLKDHKYSTCKTCGQRDKVVQEESFGCDGCGKPIDELLNSQGKNHSDYLRLDVHYQDGRAAESFEFCSWPCVVKKLKKIKTDYFVALPYLNYESDTVKDQSFKDFLRLLK